MKKQVKAGNVYIGGGAPVSIQSMCNTKTADAAASIEQVKRLEEAGCEIVRLTVPDQDAVEGFREVKRHANIPVVADIHFDHRMAIAAMDAGADKIRINPGNIGSEENVKAVVDKAKACHVPIRVGVNGGSLEKDILARHGRVTAEGLAESALRNVALLEKFGFEDIVISLKSSDVQMNYDAYKIVDRESDYPLHIGVTEAGTPSRGRIKSAAGIGALLLAGIGDTLRVSLTADPVEEVYFARELLAAVGLRRNGPNVVSCPTCGRTEVDLERIATDVERRLADLYRKDPAVGDLTVAVMGCAVNGPGEAREADYGVACGKGEGLLFAKGGIVRKVKEEDITEELLKLICKRF
ncbi:MAG: flavodoxin-dependent (E)-4-hydroxy-3-methylbut-2-enyl-diphosphate synthase [Ruminococcaceae bacterium]|nr:flavodoxin-dependent (E)-4-hydroxy-3-methylbut-2-enyl-diphosphate synthase [Oscillospiraceae bacterium]